MANDKSPAPLPGDDIMDFGAPDTDVPAQVKAALLHAQDAQAKAVIGTDIGNESEPAKVAPADTLTLEQMLAKDWTGVPDEELPSCPPGYVYRYVKEGEDYKQRLTTDSVVVLRSPVGSDGLELDQSIITRGKWADMDFRWGCEKNEFDMSASRDNGFVPVKESIDPRHEFSGGRQRKGDLFLMYRPKQVTAIREAESKMMRDAMMGAPLAEFEAQSEEGGTYKYSGAMDMHMEGRGPNGEHAHQRIIQEQEKTTQLLREQADRGRKSFAINAPFQKTIINGQRVS